MAFFNYIQSAPTVVAESEIDNRLQTADSQEHRLPFNDGDIVRIPVPESLGTVDWQCLDGNGNPTTERRNKGSFLVLLGCSYATGETIESIALSLFRTKPAFTPAADGSRPIINGIAPRSAKPSQIWAAIKALPTKGSRSNKYHEVQFKSLEYAGADGKYHTLSAFVAVP